MVVHDANEVQLVAVESIIEVIAPKHVVYVLDDGQQPSSQSLALYAVYQFVELLDGLVVSLACFRPFSVGLEGAPRLGAEQHLLVVGVCLSLQLGLDVDDNVDARRWVEHTLHAAEHALRALGVFVAHHVALDADALHLVVLRLVHSLDEETLLRRDGVDDDYLVCPLVVVVEQ